MKKGIILAFRVGIDVSKLSLQNCTIDIYFRDHAKRIPIENHLKSNPYVENIMGMTIGWCDLNFELMVENIDSLTRIIDDIDNRFPGAIRRTNFWMGKQVHKERWMPEIY